MSARRKDETLQLAYCLPKVRLISQPDFGHELRQANLTIANLSGRVTQAELAERDARDNVDVMQRTIKSLEGELNDLQEAENVELQHLASKYTQCYRENTQLVREISLKDIQMKSLEKFLMELRLVSTPNAHAPLIGPEPLGPNAHSMGHSSSFDTPDPSTNKGSEELGPSPSSTDNASLTDDTSTISVESTNSVKSTNSIKILGQEKFDSFERESSLLRDVDIGSVRPERVSFPVDAITNQEAKKWLPKAFQLVDVDLGPHYAQFLGHWFQFERLHNWNKSGGRLAVVGRPALILQWIKEGRYLPQCTEPLIGVDGLEQYSRELGAWWRSMRPKTAFDREDVGSEWIAINKYGINGWLSIVVGVKWWGKCLKLLAGDDLKTSAEEWLSMVKDLTQIIQDLHAYLDKQ